MPLPSSFFSVLPVVSVQQLSALRLAVLNPAVCASGRMLAWVRVWGAVGMVGWAWFLFGSLGTAKSFFLEYEHRKLSHQASVINSVEM